VRPLAVRAVKLSLPSHRAFVVTEGSGPDRASWHDVGALWPNKNGNGWLLVVHAGISISGRIVIVERKEKPAGNNGGEAAG